MTLRRRLDAHAFPHAFRSDADGKGRKDTWRIPASDLRAAGFVLPGNEPATAATPAKRMVELESKVAALEQEVAVWRALADERDRHLADLRQVLGLRAADDT